MNKIAVIGSRTFDDYGLLKRILDKFSPEPFVLISGHAGGADLLAEQYAEERSLLVCIHNVEWKKYGRGAAHIRNRKIIEEAPDTLIAFWDKKSKGAEYTIEKALKKGIHVYVVDFSTENPDPEPYAGKTKKCKKTGHRTLDGIGRRLK